MPAAKPPEFRRRAVELARQGDVPIAQLAKDLGIAESGLRRWMKQADLDEGRRDDGLTSDERKEPRGAPAPQPGVEIELEILKRTSAYVVRGERPPKKPHPVVCELTETGIPVVVACRVLCLSTSGFCDWLRRPPAARTLADQELTAVIADVHTASYGTYGVRRCTPSCASSGTYGSDASGWSG